MPKPSVGRIAHYVSYGTPVAADGTQAHTSECRAAVITELTGDPADPTQVGLAVFNPTGMFFNRAVSYNAGEETPGDPSCPSADTHGQPFRYCACGWAEAAPKGGTWHWPEREES